MNYDTHHLHHLQIICPTHNFFLNIIFHKRHISHTLFVLYIILLYTICLIHHFQNTSCVLQVLYQIHHFTYLSFVLQIIFPAQHLSWTKNSLDRFLLNPIPAGGDGGVNLTPLVVFLHNSKSIGLRIHTQSPPYILKALPLGLKPGFNTNCLSPQAHCLNDWFFL